MKIFKTPIMLIVFSVILSSCSVEDDGIYFDETLNTEYNYSNIDLDVLEEVNNYRESIGIKPLQLMNLISTVANSHTQYMAETGCVNHDKFSERLELLRQTANAKSVGENVAFGYHTAEEVVCAWLASESHRDQIENPSFTHFGISSIANEQGRLFYTQIFIKN